MGWEDFTLVGGFRFGGDGFEKFSQMSAGNPRHSFLMRNVELASVLREI